MIKTLNYVKYKFLFFNIKRSKKQRIVLSIYFARFAYKERDKQ